MKLSIINICRIVAISLLVGVIWQSTVLAAVMPLFEPLGQIEDGLRHPTIIDVDANGNIYLVDSRKRAVVKIDKYGEIVGEFVDSAYRGRGLAVSADGSRVYVAKEDAVAVLDGSTGAVVGTLGKGQGEFQVAGEIDLDASGFIFVADYAAKYVKVYNPDGEFQYQFGGQGFGAGQLYTIVAMSVNEAAGEVYVADPASVRRYSYPKVQVYDLSGRFLRTLRASSGFGSPTVIHFGGMAFDNAGRGYFLDKFSSRIRVMGMPATPLGGFGQAGYEPGQINFPNDLAFDPETSRLFVLNDDGRIEVFGIDGGHNPVDANEAPGMPAPVSPIADSEVPTATPQLEFENAVDPDGDALTYDAQLYLDGALDVDYIGQPESGAVSYVQVSDELTENARYEWQVRAFDGEDASGWTAAESFYVNAVEESPAAPELAESVEDVLDGTGALMWHASADPDPFDTISYVVEISTDPAFASVDASALVEGLSVMLGDVENYGELVDGQEYFWRVLARDNHDLLSEPSAAGSFTYDTTIIKVAANMPGASVFLGGNLGYPGRPVGEAPVELRDVQPGVTSVVVERAGLEPFVAQVAPAYRENVEVYAALVPAIAPSDLKARPLMAGDAKLEIGEAVAPFLVDFDNDGLIDLLFGTEAGSLQLAMGEIVLNEVAEEEFVFSVPQSVHLSRVVAGMAPFVADWDNDGRKDLIVGGADGTVTLFLNAETEPAPAFGAGEALSADGEVIAVAGPAVPAVYDVDGDEDKDLLVGTGSGEVLLYRNDGEDAEPVLAGGGNVFVLPSGVGSATGEVAPVFVDWDADGQRELIAATGQHLYVCEEATGNTFVAQSVLSVADALVSGGGKKGNGSYSLGDDLRVFALDFDAARGKDMIVGNAAGEIRFAASFGIDYVSSLRGALLDKVSQIDGMVSESAPELSGDVAAIAAAVDAEDYRTAKRLARALAGSVPVGTDLAVTVDELTDVLPQK